MYEIMRLPAKENTEDPTKYYNLSREVRKIIKSYSSYKYRAIINRTRDTPSRNIIICNTTLYAKKKILDYLKMKKILEYLKMMKKKFSRTSENNFESETRVEKMENRTRKLPESNEIVQKRLGGGGGAS